MKLRQGIVKIIFLPVNKDLRNRFQETIKDYELSHGVILTGINKTKRS